LEVARAGHVHQNLPHQFGSDGEEVGSVLPAHLLGFDQPQVSLVDQGGGL